MVPPHFLFVLMATLPWISAMLTICSNPLAPLYSSHGLGSILSLKCVSKGLTSHFMMCFSAFLGRYRALSMVDLAPHPRSLRTPGMKMKYVHEVGSVAANLVAGSVLREKVGRGMKTFLEKETNPL